MAGEALVLQDDSLFELPDLYISNLKLTELVSINGDKIHVFPVI